MVFAGLCGIQGAMFLQKVWLQIVCLHTWRQSWLRVPRRPRRMFFPLLLRRSEKYVAGKELKVKRLAGFNAARRRFCQVRAWAFNIFLLGWYPDACYRHLWTYSVLTQIQKGCKVQRASTQFFPSNTIFMCSSLWKPKAYSLEMVMAIAASVVMGCALAARKTDEPRVADGCG